MVKIQYFIGKLNPDSLGSSQVILTISWTKFTLKSIII